MIDELFGKGSVLNNLHNHIKAEIIKTNTSEILREIADLIDAGEYEKVLTLLANSPSGDGWGSDNNFIDFNAGLVKVDEPLDLAEVIEIIQRLR